MKFRWWTGAALLCVVVVVQPITLIGLLEWKHIVSQKPAVLAIVGLEFGELNDAHRRLSAPGCELCALLLTRQ